MDELKFLKNAILEEWGFNLSAYKESTLKRRISIRMEENGLKSFIAYARFLKNNNEEYKKLMETLTINFTEFFRDPSVFNAIQELVLPNLKGKKFIRVWSAGCATGEEAYSIGILLKEKIKTSNISVLATDVNESNLNFAKKGTFKANQLRNLDEKILEKYFQYDNNYLIRNNVKNIVRFMRHDLIADNPVSIFDMVCCRNVLIYFNRDIQKDIFQKIYQSLKPKGFLVIGKTETIHQEFKEKFEIINPIEKIYRKI